MTMGAADRGASSARTARAPPSPPVVSAAICSPPSGRDRDVVRAPPRVGAVDERLHHCVEIVLVVEHLGDLDVVDDGAETVGRGEEDIGRQ